MAVIEWDDPCARYAALRDAYFNLLQGGVEILIRYKGPESEEEVRYAATKLDVLKLEMISAQAECSAATGTPNPNRRFAIRGGSQRRRCF